MSPNELRKLQAEITSIQKRCQIGSCPNTKCPPFFIARHIYSYYAERLWRHYAEPNIHFGEKVIVDTNFFAA